ncbi:MAG: DUF4059 family protein [Streptococcaceae bacterium]|jgi:hypothetical protein|nr:DUF4059 family protein [Streptococcaceae bacterium]
MQAILSLYFKSLFIAAVVVLIISGIYFLGLIARYADQPKHIRQNRFFDLLLMDILTIPVLSFAVLAVLIILKAR